MYELLLKYIVSLFIIVSICGLFYLLNKFIMYLEQSEIKARENRKMRELNDIMVFEDNKIYYVHEIIDFKKTIKEPKGIHIKKDGNNTVKKVIEWDSYKGKIENLSGEERIVAQIIPSKPLDDKTLKKVIGLIKETRKYEKMRKKQEDKEKLYKTYKKANHSPERLHDTNKLEKSMVDYNESLLSEYGKNEKRIKDNYENISSCLNEYAKRKTNG